MKPLQENPHLFANGKFKIKYSSGLIKKLDAFSLAYIAQDEDCDIESTYLIARPIKDMTDEEVKQFNEIGTPLLYNENNEEEALKQIKESIGLWSSEHLGLQINSVLYLLSIGVYPFDQSHFEDGTVIDSREVVCQD